MPNFVNNVNLNGNEIQNVRFQSLAAAPAVPMAGMFYFDTVCKRFKYYDGSSWVTPGDGGIRYKGTVGTGGTVETLPAEDVEIGDMYKVIADGNYSSQDAKRGDLFIAISKVPEWSYVPSGDDGNVYKYSETNPELTGSGGQCLWTVAHGLNNAYPVVQIYETLTGEMVLADIVSKSLSEFTVAIRADSVSEGTYSVLVMG